MNLNRQLKLFKFVKKFTVTCFSYPLPQVAQSKLNTQTKVSWSRSIAVDQDGASFCFTYIIERYIDTEW